MGALTSMLQGWFEEIFGSGVFKQVASVLQLDPSRGEFATAWTAVHTVYNNVMVPIALGLMVIWFLVALMQKSASEQITIEQFLMLFVKLIAAKFLIDNGLDIFTKLWSLGISLISEVGDAFSNGSSFSFDYKEFWHDKTGVEWGKNLGLWEALGLMMELLLPWIISKVMVACVYFICYSRLIEMLLRMFAAPIAVSDFITEGLHGAGWRYLKSFLAICLQGMLIVAIAQLYPLLMSGVLTTTGNFWTTILKHLAFSFAAIALMFKSLSLSKELVGVG